LYRKNGVRYPLLIMVNWRSIFQPKIFNKSFPEGEKS